MRVPDLGGHSITYRIAVGPHRGRDVETCPSCGGTAQIIARAEDLPVIERILNHLASKDLPGLWAESRAPPGPVGLPH